MNVGAGPSALTFDVWYTLLYLSPVAQRSYARARNAAWLRALEADGLSGSEARARLRSLVAEGRRCTAAGRAFPLADQLRFATRRRWVDVRPLETALSRALAEVPVRRTAGAPALLDRLRAEGRALALVSNVLYEPTPDIRRILAETELASRVDTVVLSNEAGSAKPSGKLLRLALDRLGVAPADCLHLGDTDYDLLSAWRAGASAARFVGLRHLWPPAPPRPPGFPTVRVPRVARWSDLSTDRLVVVWRRARGAADRARHARA